MHTSVRFYNASKFTKLPSYPGFIQARLCKIQGLFKDFSKTFLLFSRTENLRKILIYKLKFYFWNARVQYKRYQITIISIKLWCLYAAPNKGTTILYWSRSPKTLLNPPVNGKIQELFKAFECFSSTFQGKFYFQGLFMKFLYIQVLFRPVRTLLSNVTDTY